LKITDEWEIVGWESQMTHVPPLMGRESQNITIEASRAAAGDSPGLAVLAEESDQDLLSSDVLIPVETVEQLAVVDRRSWPVRALRWIGSAIEWCVGGVAVVIGLAALAPLPILQFMSLGYLLEVSGRIGRTGRFSQGFIGFRSAARLGTIVLGTFLLLLPLRYVAFMARNAELIAPGSPAARGWGFGLLMLTGLLVVHLITAYWRGGKLRDFLLPANPRKLVRRWRQPGAISDARDAVWSFVTDLRLPYYFWLGARGFVGGLIWLAIPVTMLAFGGKPPLRGPLGVLFAVVGAVLLMGVLVYLPFLQARFAAENRFKAMFEVRAVRDMFRRAPIAFWIALFFTLALALPLYLLKIEIVPRDAAGLPSLFFVLSIFPARLLSGWAYARAQKRERPRNWFLRWTSRLAMLPVVAFYVFIVYFTQYTSWHGVWSLYEQHSFLVPVPFLGM
jgi:hypothetical protein